VNLNFFIKITLLVLLVVFIAIFGYFFVGKAKQAQDIKMGELIFLKNIPKNWVWIGKKII